METTCSRSSYHLPQVPDRRMDLFRQRSCNTRFQRQIHFWARTNFCSGSAHVGERLPGRL